MSFLVKDFNWISHEHSLSSRALLPNSQFLFSTRSGCRCSWPSPRTCRIYIKHKIESTWLSRDRRPVEARLLLDKVPFACHFARRRRSSECSEYLYSEPCLPTAHHSYSSAYNPTRRLSNVPLSSSGSIWRVQSAVVLGPTRGPATEEVNAINGRGARSASTRRQAATHHPTPLHRRPAV